MVAFIALAGCSPAREPRQAILILLDAARADRLSCYGYGRETTPNIDKLAARGAVFLNHFVQDTHTRGTLPTIFYSRYFTRPLFPYSDSVSFSSPAELFQGIDEEAISMVEALSGAGFKTGLITAHGWLKPGTALARQFDEILYLPGTETLDPSYGYPRADRVVDAAIDWIDRNAESDFFLYVHLMDTHFPHHLEEDARDILPPEVYGASPPRIFSMKDRLQDARAVLNGDERLYLDALYDGSLHYADLHLGRLFSHVHERLGDTLIAVTSDHGEMLLEAPGRYLHGSFWYDILARVPLVIVNPGSIEPRRFEGFSEGVDLMPTILGALGASVPSGKAMDGVDLRSVLDGTREEKSHVFSPRAARDRRYKWIVTGSMARLMTAERPILADLEGMLYDLRSDPLEIENLWDERPEAVSEMLDAYRRAMQPHHRRYASARRSALPEGPFALEVRHFWPTIVPKEVRLLEDMPAGASARPSGGEWISDLKMTHLLGRRGAVPLSFEMRIPDGRYRLSVFMRGTGALTLEDGEARRLAASPVDMDEPFPWKGERVEVGEIRITGDRFAGVFTADPEGQRFLVRHLGFTPLPADGEEPVPVDEELLERLRTLGYVE